MQVHGLQVYSGLRRPSKVGMTLSHVDSAWHVAPGHSKSFFAAATCTCSMHTPTEELMTHHVVACDARRAVMEHRRQQAIAGASRQPLFIGRQKTCRRDDKLRSQLNASRVLLDGRALQRHQTTDMLAAAMLLICAEYCNADIDAPQCQ